LIDEKLRGKNVFVVIWTTTPWTLPANLGISVHPDFDYSAVEAKAKFISSPQNSRNLSPNFAGLTTQKN
jgi:isoleucyl-tRNA synthetase